MQPARIPSLSFTDATKKRAEIRRYFHQTWNEYESLFGGLVGDTPYYSRANPLRHPLIFYFGHTATFYVNKLLAAQLICERVDGKMEAMLAVGVDEMSWDDLSDKVYDWPSVNEVQSYRNQVRDMVDGFIRRAPLLARDGESGRIGWEDPFWIILMGIEHERIHLETSSVLIRELPLEMVQPSEQWPVCSLRSQPPENTWIPVAGASVQLGRSREKIGSQDLPQSHDAYGWDNEYGTSQVEVQAFQASKFLVSNAEYRAFVDDGGYETEAWWTDEGWCWRGFRKAEYPVFWREHKTGFTYRAMLEETPMPWSWPVDVCCHEAQAFCRWASAQTGGTIRLPSEAEWMQIHHLSGLAGETSGVRASANVNLEQWASSCPVDYFQHGPFGDVVGNVWQWSESTIDGLPGFEVHPAYDDFSVPTFDGRHNIIKGGSWISTGNSAMHDSRYAFRRHFFQHAGFRTVKGARLETDTTESTMNVYETDESISQYLEFHYGEEYFGVPNFPKACIEQTFDALKTLGIKHVERALDLGCGVGRSGFELARNATHVDSIDFSTRFIRNAAGLQESGSLHYHVTVEGDLRLPRDLTLEGLGLSECSGQVHFSQGDACNLKAQFTNYDLIFAGNLIDRLYDPSAFLTEVHQRLRPRGVLVLTSPYTWLEEHTPKTSWIGGVERDGKSIATLDGLKEVLSDRFEMAGPPRDIPFVIRETARKFQHSVAQMSVWRLRK